MSNSVLVRLPTRRASDVEAIEAPVVDPIEPVDQIDLRELARKLWRRKRAILGTAATLMMLAVLTVFQLTPIYRASASVMIDPRQPKIVDIEQVLAGLSPDSETIQSEMEVLRSRDLAKQTVAKLGLDRDPEFNETLRQNRWSALLRLGAHLPGWASMPFEAPARADEPREVQQSRIVDAFEDRLSIVPQPHSRVIRIGFESKNPALAARIVNTLVDFYLVSQIKAKFEATRRANGWLSDRLKGLRDQVLASEGAVEAFRKQAGLLRSKVEGGKETTIATEELSGVNLELVKAQADRMTAEAKLRQVQETLPSGAGVDATSSVLQSPLIQRLREQQAQVERRASELGARFGASYPLMISVTAEARDLQHKIEMETGKIVQSLWNDVIVARTREAALEVSVITLSDGSPSRLFDGLPATASRAL